MGYLFHPEDRDGADPKSSSAQGMDNAGPAASLVSPQWGLCLTEASGPQFPYTEVRAGGLSLIGLFLLMSVPEMFVDILTIILWCLHSCFSSVLLSLL